MSYKTLTGYVALACSVAGLANVSYALWEMPTVRVLNIAAGLVCFVCACYAELELRRLS